jgi:hypothetical protein
MPQNVTPWEWTDARLLAAQRVADGRQTDEEIAAEAGVHRKTLHLWKHRPEFAARVAELTAALEAAVLKTGIADRRRRVEAMNRRWEGMQRVIDERAADPDMQSVPGGSTGLLAHDVKIIGAGDSAEKVDVYEVDTGLLRELREVEKQAAQDLGQWTEKREHTGTGPGGAIVVVNLGPGQTLDDL